MMLSIKNQIIMEVTPIAVTDNTKQEKEEEEEEEEEEEPEEKEEEVEEKVPPKAKGKAKPGRPLALEEGTAK